MASEAVGRGRCPDPPPPLGAQLLEVVATSNLSGFHSFSFGYRGGGGTSLPGVNVDGDNFGRGKFRHLQES